jgi:hypothetical protein
MSGPCTARVRVMSRAFPKWTCLIQCILPASLQLSWPGFTQRVRARCRRKTPAESLDHQPHRVLMASGAAATGAPGTGTPLSGSSHAPSGRQPSRPGPWAFRLAAPALHPLAIVSNECGEIVPKPVHISRISTVRERGGAAAGRRRCRDGASSRMLSCKHSMETRPPLELLARGAKSIPCFRCSASPPTTICAPVYRKAE